MLLHSPMHFREEKAAVEARLEDTRRRNENLKEEVVRGTAEVDRLTGLLSDTRREEVERARSLHDDLEAARKEISQEEERTSEVEAKVRRNTKQRNFIRCQHRSYLCHEHPPLCLLASLHFASLVLFAGRQTGGLPQVRHEHQRGARLHGARQEREGPHPSAAPDQPDDCEHEEEDGQGGGQARRQEEGQEEEEDGEGDGSGGDEEEAGELITPLSSTVRTPASLLTQPLPSRRRTRRTRRSPTPTTPRLTPSRERGGGRPTPPPPPPRRRRRPGGRGGRIMILGAGLRSGGEELR